MHTHSMATGLAIARLVNDAPEGLAQEAAEYVERARVKLALDNSAIVAALMFAQPLIKMWVPHWCGARPIVLPRVQPATRSRDVARPRRRKFAYTIGLSIGVKFTTEGETCPPP